MASFYYVLYSTTYGGFGIGNFELLNTKFPEKGFNTDDIADAEDFRDDQELIAFMLEEGLEKFKAHYCELGVEQIPIINGFKLKYKVKEYDGKENVYPEIEYKRIINDLIENKTEYPLTDIVRKFGLKYLEDLVHSI